MKLLQIPVFVKATFQQFRLHELGEVVIRQTTVCLGPQQSHFVSVANLVSRCFNKCFHRSCISRVTQIYLLVRTVRFNIVLATVLGRFTFVVSVKSNVRYLEEEFRIGNESHARVLVSSFVSH